VKRYENKQERVKKEVPINGCLLPFLLSTERRCADRAASFF